MRLEIVLNEQLAFERRIEAFAHCVVVAIANRSHRGTYAGLTQSAQAFTTVRSAETRAIFLRPIAMY